MTMLKYLNNEINKAIADVNISKAKALKHECTTAERIMFSTFQKTISIEIRKSYEAGYDQGWLAALRECMAVIKGERK